MSDYSQCIRVPYPDPDEVTEEHRNFIILSNYFMLKPGCTDKQQEKDRIMLKIFPAFIYSVDRQMFLDQKLQSLLHVMPVKFYKVHQFDYDNTIEFQHANIGGDWLVEEPIDQQVLVYYTKVQSVGCEHYIRGCTLWCDKCQKFFNCRLCHDAEVDDHQFDRYAVEKVKCRYCALEQPFDRVCRGCKRSFGWYICHKCKMICGLGQDAKPNYHCDGCKMCMVGNRNFSRHCFKCNSCYSADYFDKHTCQQVQGDCTVCMEDIVNTIYGRYVPACGHAMHSHCYQTLYNMGNYKCPICRRFLPKEDDRESIIKWTLMNYSNIFIPRQYQNMFVQCKCNDCQQQFPQHFSLFKYFCSSCRNFNVDAVGDSSLFEYISYISENEEWLAPQLPQPAICRQFLLNKFRDQFLRLAGGDQFDEMVSEDIAKAIAEFLHLDVHSEADQDLIVQIANEYGCSTIGEMQALLRGLRGGVEDGGE